MSQINTKVPKFPQRHKVHPSRASNFVKTLHHDPTQVVVYSSLPWNSDDPQQITKPMTRSHDSRFPRVAFTGNDEKRYQDLWNLNKNTILPTSIIRDYVKPDTIKPCRIIEQESTPDNKEISPTKSPI